MKRIILFSKYFVPAMVVSAVLVAAGIAGYFLMGFNLGVDFQAGLIQEIQFAPAAFELTYGGRGNASVSLSRNNLTIVISGAGIDEVQHDYPFSTYRTLGALTGSLASVEGVKTRLLVSGDIQSAWLVQSAQSNPQLGQSPFVMHYLSPGEEPIPIDEVRSSLLPLGTVSVQVLGNPADRRFMIRMQDSEVAGEKGVPAEKIIATLEAFFGAGGVAVTRSDYVGSRFSKQLTDQAGLLLVFTLLLILLYASIRFKFQYAMGAVLAILHDGLIVIAFVVWTRIEFNTTTIAAILTILGYSINDTIVIFDRIRETRRIYPDNGFIDVLNRAITETLGRTVITTFTTMLAVVFLYIFTTGSMRDFALCLLVGMTSGVYSTIFIASGFVSFWEKQTAKKASKKKLRGPAPVPAKA
ncbi:MAG: protein translocase subunit SecF [Treponema sp.]|jgi:preprotein translocase subunit SecF|nr:protein translocase subunit SecF [Treponema sp.]